MSRTRNPLSHSLWLARMGAILAIAALTLIIGVARASAMPFDPFVGCHAVYGENVGPPLMSQPNGGFQTLSRDCSGTFACSDYFHVILQAGDTLSLTFCSNGGTANFDTNLSVWSGPTFETLVECNGDSCGSLSELTFVADETGTYRVRIGQDGLAFYAMGGAYTLAYSAPVGSTIVPATCGNGTLDAGEQCDDGNEIGGDCCSTSCEFAASGAVCPDDGNDCTDEQCDGAGTCLHPNTIAGTFCTGDGFFCTDDICDGAGTCTHPTVPDCNSEPPCGPALPPGNPMFEHPKKATLIQSSLVQAFVGCGNVSGGIPNTTTEGGVPSCETETPNEDAGSPTNGWRWDSTKAKGQIDLKRRCPGAADFGLKLRLYGVIDGTSAPATGTGTLALVVRMTLDDPDGGDMTTISFPMELPFNLSLGSAKIKTSANAILSEADLPPLPNGTSIETRGVDMFDGGLLEVRDPNGNAFARPGLFLP